MGNFEKVLMNMIQEDTRSIEKHIMHILDINSWTYNKRGVNRVEKYLLTTFIDRTLWKVKKYHHPDVGDLVIILPKRPSPGKRILLSMHVDTVFHKKIQQVSENSTTIFGPGATDMQSSLIVALSALQYLTTYCGKVPNVCITLIPDEEVGSTHYKEILHTYYQERFNLAIVFEGCGDHEESVIERRSVTQIKISSQGKSGHSGTAFNTKNNAIIPLAQALLEIALLNDPEMYPGLSINIGTIHGGTQANVIPEYAESIIDVRSFLPELYHVAVKEIEKVVDQFKLQKEILCDIPPLTNQETKLEPFIPAIKKSFMFAGLPFTTEKRGGGSDGNQIGIYGTPVIDGWGPMGNEVHTHNEFVEKYSIPQRIKVLAHFLYSQAYNHEAIS